MRSETSVLIVVGEIGEPQSPLSSSDSSGAAEPDVLPRVSFLENATRTDRMPRDSLKSPFKGFSKAGRTFPMELYQEARWYACRTRARAEKMVGKLLGQAGFEAYLPLV